MVEKVLTANRLTDGIAVWLDAAGGWSEDLQTAFVARHDEAVAALEETGRKALSDNLVVDVNVIEVEETDGKLWPTRLRERVRAGGPTIPYAKGHGFADPDFIAA
ncbi:DUF2849 domain-containing protein [Rhizobium halophytocola]|uniref:DUF2849 domain-containing protein n=1 Tax=Rhizobium halophytocola TaxID=735519 RepID=A0ABS4DWN5_9HYPH|nr:DUF2849 domain-containing protein [Rhizobium halophytocola]MBP1850054.1 hypothetical protein [Rhizobium halophytocola]